VRLVADRPGAMYTPQEAFSRGYLDAVMSETSMLDGAIYTAMQALKTPNEARIAIKMAHRRALADMVNDSSIDDFWNTISSPVVQVYHAAHHRTSIISF
jgi:hypothetical protein